MRQTPIAGADIRRATTILTINSSKTRPPVNVHHDDTAHITFSHTLDRIRATQYKDSHPNRSQAHTLSDNQQAVKKCSTQNILRDEYMQLKNIAPDTPLVRKTTALTKHKALTKAKRHIYAIPTTMRSNRSL